MLETFTLETFADRIGETFRVRTGDAGSTDLRLIEAADRRERGDGSVAAPDDVRPTPFALLFRGPSEPVLPQRIHAIEHDEIGAFDLFLVPVGPDAEGRMRYEAVFT
ncbi:MAG: DUF6916 family protein [Gemmatimonadota bacterium]